MSLNVTVTDGPKYVTGLEQGDFDVFEDGVKQSLTFFSQVQQPIALAILLDTSNSMEDKLATAQEAAIGFVRRMKKDDAIEVIDFNSQVRIPQPFTSDVAALERAIRQTTVERLDLALQRALRLAQGAQERAREERRGNPPPGDRRALRRRRHLEPDRVRGRARARQAIGNGDLRDRPAAAGDRAGGKFKEAEFVLRQLSQETGGRVFFPASIAELPKIYEQISEELASQYSIAYSSKNPMRNGAWRRIDVRVNKPGLVARTRRGYYGPTGQ